MITIAVTQHELLLIIKGSQLDVPATDGTPYALRSAWLKPRSGPSGVGSPETVFMFEGDAENASRGRTTSTVTSKGDWIDVRLATLDEFRDRLARSNLWLREAGLPAPEQPTDEEILDMISPVS